ncbi:RluA family pseudouridine synthase [Paradesulfitobacterium aromaticivorans]
MAQKEPWLYILQPEDEGKKYFEILHHKFHFSRRLLQNLKQGEKAWVDGRFTFLSARGHAGETLTIELFSPEEATIPATSIPSSISVSMASNHGSLSQRHIAGMDAVQVAASLGLEILYEDDYILAVNKRAGQVVHPNPRYPAKTLGNDVIAYWESQRQPRPFRPVHRIDRNTTGVVVIAKNTFAHQQLAHQLESRLIYKRYLGFVSGGVKHDTGLIDQPIGLEPGSFIKRKVRADGLPALTEFRVLKRYRQATLLEFILHTGRTHQIRAHCQSIGHPLLGDDLYGGDTSLIERQALHAFIYSFLHPASGRRISIRASIPPDVKLLIRKLKKASTLGFDNRIT